MMIRSALPSLALLWALGTPSARATEILDVSGVRPGMTGYGLSVFKGTKIERFQVKVLGVLKNAFPKMDMILIRCSGANLDHSGIVAGMSGSPIYLEDRGKARLIGALAYGWTFSKDPIAGVTPIRNMLAEAKRPLRRPVASLKSQFQHPQLRPAATPLYLSGFVGSILKDFAPQFKKWNFIPLQGSAGSPAGAHKIKVELEPGSAIGVQLMRGDLNITGVGTVTYREGDTVLAFGHPMMGIGELRFPITTAWVHHVFAGLARSFKMAGAISPVGTLVQDRRPTIVGKVGPSVKLIPMRINVVNSQAGRRDVYNMEVIHHQDFTPLLAFIAILNSVRTSASDTEEVSFDAQLNLKLRGRPEIQVRDQLFSADGVVSFGLFASPVFRTLQDLYSNRFEKVRAERVEYTIDLLFRRDLERIEEIKFDQEALTPGKLARARVQLRPYMGTPYERVVQFKVPKSLEGRTISVQVAGGPRAPLDRPIPERFNDLISNLSIRHPSKSIVVTLQTPMRSFKVNGYNLTDLPRTVIDAFNPANSSGTGLVTSGIRQTVIPTKRVVVGRRVARIRVKRIDE